MSTHRSSLRASKSRRLRSLLLEPLEARQLMAQVTAGEHLAGAFEIPDDAVQPIEAWFERQAQNAFKYASDLSRYSAQEIVEAVDWVLHIAPTGDASALVALLGAENMAVTDIIDNTYIYTLPAGTNRTNIGETIQSLPHIDYAYPLTSHEYIEVKFRPNDTLYNQQWHLHNTGQSGGTAGEDPNLEAAWDINRGSGVVIAVVDDGVEYTHPDLAGHYLSNLSTDLVDGDNTPLPGPGNFDFHGTAVAGVANANTNNSTGTAGAAPDARFAAIRLLGLNQDDQTEAAAVIFNNQAIHVYNHSWGAPDDGAFVGAGPLMIAAMAQSVQQGRGGLGNIHMWAGGNGFEFNQEDSNSDGYANSPFALTIGALNHSGGRAPYSEPGANLLVSTYAEGGSGVVTTDIGGNDGYNDSPGDTIDGDNLSDLNYTSTFGGTSSATPLASGIVALMVAANPNLSWRDVSEILARSARKNDPNNRDWRTNAAGLNINHNYGFGSIDALAAVNMARTWTNLAQGAVLLSPTFTTGQVIPDDGGVNELQYAVNVANDFRIERLELVVDITHTLPEELEITIESPDGTESILAREHFTFEDTTNQLQGWSFTSTRHLGERVAGDWILTVRDRVAGDQGTFNAFTLNFLGTVVPAAPVPARISGVIFEDTNGNGVFETTERYLPGTTVYVDSNNNGSFDTGEPTQISNTNGRYTFTNMTPGTYTVNIITSPIHTKTFPAAPGTYTVTLAASQQAINNNFGVRPPPIGVGPYYLNNGPGDGSVNVGVDGFGSFGSAVGSDADEAYFDPLGSITQGETTFESGVAIGIGGGSREFLSTGIDAFLDNPQVTGTPTQGSSDFVYDNLLFHLQQTLAPLNNTSGVRIGSQLVQTYTITNFGTSALNFDLVRYFDGDLYFDGSLVDGGGRITVGNNEILFEIDSATGRADSSTFIGIETAGGIAPGSGRYEADSYSGLLSDIQSGGTPTDSIAGDGPDGDQFVDAGNGYDITLALLRQFNLAPGASTTYVTTTYFGSGTPGEVVDPPGTIVEPPPPPPFQFGGVVTNDINNNATFDAGEPGIPGVIVYLDLNNDGQLGLGEPAQITNSAGQYRFQVREGTYIVRQIQLAGWIPSAPSAGHYEVTGVSGDFIDNLFFGNNAQTDWSDAPATFGSASHSVLSGFYLGSRIDGEGSAQPSSQANGDDAASFDDDDGVTFVGNLVAGQTNSLELQVHNGGRGAGLLNAWIDFNANGTFEDDEHIFRNKNVSDGLNHLNFFIPATAKLGNTFARFRYGYGVGPNGNGILPTGPVTGGEVEDYYISLIGLKPQATPDAFHIVHDTVNNILNVLANDIASPQGPLTITEVSTGSLGSQIVLNSDQTISYTPKPGVASGTETFTYTVSDFKGGVATTTVTITIGNPIIPPVANDDRFNVAANAVGVNLDVRANDVTPGAALTSLSVNRDTVKGGYVTVNSNLTLRYAPPVNFVGIDQFEYTLRDALGFVTSAIVTVHVGNDAANDLAGLEVTITDTNGTPIAGVMVGTEFQVRISATDKRSAPTDPGVLAAYLDLLYTNGIVAPKTANNAYGLDVTFPAAFDMSFSASAPQAGLIDELGAARSSAPGSSGPSLLAIVTFVASAVGSAKFTADPADQTITHDVRMGNPAFTVGIDQVTYGSATVNVIPNPNLSFKNIYNGFDVDGDGKVTPLDALLVINELNARGPRNLEGRSVPSRGARFVDVSGDVHLSAIDALMVVNFLNARSTAEGEAGSSASAPGASYDSAWFDASDEEEEDLLSLLASDQ